MKIIPDYFTNTFFLVSMKQVLSCKNNIFYSSYKKTYKGKQNRKYFNSRNKEARKNPKKILLSQIVRGIFSSYQYFSKNRPLTFFVSHMVINNIGIDSCYIYNTKLIHNIHPAFGSWFCYNQQ